MVYFGEELGMLSKDFPHKEIQDPLGKRYWPIHKGRDAERRPMQWDFSENMGFSTAKPWLEPNYTKRWHLLTVESQEKDRDSMLSFYRALIKLRKERTEISKCDALFCDSLPHGMLGYRFEKNGKCTAVLLNMSKKWHRIKLSDVAPGSQGMEIALKTYNRVEVCIENGELQLPPGLGVVLTN